MKNNEHVFYAHQNVVPHFSALVLGLELGLSRNVEIGTK